MSLPYFSITCSVCAFRGSINFGTLYEYQGPTERAPVVGSAWCSDCDKIVSCFVPFDEHDMESRIQGLNLWIARNQRGLFARFSKEKKVNVVVAEKEISDIRKRAAFFRNNPLTPACIECGSQNIAPFVIPDGDFGETRELNVNHHCGGKLLACMKGRLSFRSHRIIVYDEFGSVISESASEVG